MLSYAQARRLKLAKIGKLILEHQDADIRLKELVQSMMEDAYSSYVMLVLVVMVPITGIIVITRHREWKPISQNTELQKLFDDLVDHHIFAASAANPIFAFLVAAEMGILTLLLFPFGRAMTGRAVQLDALRRVERHPREALAI